MTTSQQQTKSGRKSAISMALLEYRKKNSQAQDLYNGASDKFKTIMTAAGVSQ
jgi:hypothetical protein